VPERGTAAAAFSGFVRHIAGKTGTTNSARDAWFVGFAGDFVAVVWIGRNDNKPLADGETGGLLAAPVVRDFLTAAGGEFSFLDPPVPDGLVKLVVDPDTGLAARKGVEELLRPERADALRSKGPPPKGDAGDAESGGREAAPAKGMREESEPRDAGPKEYAE
jgi:penicillin-binding protein 1A